MACMHEKIKSVNCVKYCLLCGAKLPEGFNYKPEELKQEEPKKTVKRKRSEAK